MKIFIIIMTNRTIKNLQNMLEIHRYRNGRLEIDYFSRKMSPKFSLIELDGKYYDRNDLKKFIIEQGSTIVPESLRALNSKEKAIVNNKNPYRIFGKAKVYAKNIA
ncbi:hypothetical protein NY2A_B680L [Paramecium bursaria Chlorella virus NY2A]|uniref:Uncharacterized protein B680L n=1 Tax=Paramecium bursaria Chlorella virus NY2A TaxID=46021 RepID=A7IXK5_PBCVN|nr:hypothetical protein NY2A_B680L [Paramecium bursaria Chlorella virus NY2A]ABT15079.1 hypothetical protein NY2A_B680L [Paramecium bursaria Chlorella virus NY2A]